jgi:hypothetical protein
VRVRHRPLRRLVEKIVSLILPEAVAAEVARHAADLLVGRVQVKDDRLGGVKDLHQHAELRPVRRQQVGAEHRFRRGLDRVAQRHGLAQVGDH